MSDQRGGADPEPWRWGDRHVDALARVRAHLPAEVTSRLEPAGAGDFCVAFRANGWIVRVPRRAEAAAAVRREACLLARIAHRLPLAVPRPAYHAPQDCPPFTVHREVVGTALTRAAWSALPAAARARMAEQLADFMQRLHSFVDEARACELPELEEAALAKRLQAGAHAEIEAMLSADVLDRLDGFLSSRAATPGSARLVALLHADIAPGHLLYDEASGALTGVIDFGDVVLGPPARDFIYIYEDFGIERCEELVAAYAPTEAPALMEEVRAWYLLEALAWTLDRLAAGASADAAHGLAEITRELAT